MTPDAAPRVAPLVYLDCTAGLGGHAEAIARRLAPGSTVALTDLDPGNLARAAARVRALPDPPRVVAFHASFAAAPHHLRAAGLRADIVLADLGFASPQVDDPARGLSFSRDGPLDMRLDPSGASVGTTAANLVNSLPESQLADIIFRLGEERKSRQVAAAIVRARAAAPITTTSQLAEIVRSVVPRSGGPHGRGIDPATRTFQALRLAVNDELGHLDALLSAIDSAARALADPAAAGDCWLAPGARVAIISFHSLEDRPVKTVFTRLLSEQLAEDLSQGLVTPNETEKSANPRSSPSKLRAIRLRGGVSIGKT